MIKGAVLLMILILTIIISCNSRASGSIYVDDSNVEGPWDGTLEYPYKSIQEGINAASPGDTIYVLSGTYYENLVININLILKGEGKDTTIIDGGKNGHVIYAQATCTISGFTIRNAGGTGNDCVAMSYADGGKIYDCKILNSEESDGIQLDHCTNIEISNNEIIYNKAFGIGISVSENCTIKENVIKYNREGINIQSFSNNNEVYDNLIANNNLYGIRIRQSSDNRIYNNNFTNNYQNAYDQGSNQWDNGYRGNLWDDYSGIDSNGDGIGDTPYDIPGDSNQDRYPIVLSLDKKPLAYIDSISPNPAIKGETIYFSGHGEDDGTIVGWEWSSDLDGILSYSEDFSSSTLSLGTHTIKFRVKDNSGQWSDYALKTLKVGESNEKPVANIMPVANIITVNPTNITLGESVYFHGIGKDEDGIVVECKWRSSIDGFLSDKQTFNSSNLSVGNHTIYFKVKDDKGEWSEEDSIYLRVNPPPNKIPVANAGGVYSGFVNEEINLTALNSYDEDGTIVEYFWDFGDGSTGTGVNPKHFYSRPGNYTITLTVKDDSGAVATDIAYVSISQKLEKKENPTLIKMPFIIIFEILFIIFAILIFLLWIKRLR
jgi:parallel beta-helix repeat protein